MDLELEDLKGFEGLYKINRLGQVWGVKRQIFLKQSIYQGYYRVTLSKENRPKTYFVHRLLALQFLPNPLELPQVDHLDINPSNNSLDNLRWASQRTNINNRTMKSNSGEQNIYITKRNTSRVSIKLNKQEHSRTFKTMEEAKTYRDTYLRENNLN